MFNVVTQPSAEEYVPMWSLCYFRDIFLFSLEFPHSLSLKRPEFHYIVILLLQFSHKSQDMLMLYFLYTALIHTWHAFVNYNLAVQASSSTQNSFFCSIMSGTHSLSEKLN